MQRLRRQRLRHGLGCRQLLRHGSFCADALRGGDRGPQFQHGHMRKVRAQSWWKDGVVVMMTTNDS